MKIGAVRCLFIIFCVQLLITSTLSVEKKLSSSTDINLVDHGKAETLMIYNLILSMLGVLIYFIKKLLN